MGSGRSSSIPKNKKELKEIVYNKCLPESLKRPVVVRCKTEDPVLLRKRQNLQQSKSIHELSKIRNLNKFPLPVNLRLPDVPLPKVRDIIGVIARVPKKNKKAPVVDHEEQSGYSLLVFRHQIVHVGFSFSEFHLVHTLASIPMQESFTSEHSSKLFRNTLEKFLDCSRVSDKSGSHFQTTGRNVANGSLDIVGNPLNEVRAVLVLDVEHLLIDLFHGHASSEHGSDSQISAMTRITGSHHVLGIEHLLGQFGNGQRSILLATTRR